jgi:uncharacterized membrane protein YbjE (DUF340 family)
MNILVLTLFLGAGGLAGFLLRRSPRALALARIVTRVALGALLFLMGAKLALNRALLARDPGALVSAVLSAVLLLLLYFGAFWLWSRVRPAPRPAPSADEPAVRAPGELGAVLSNAGWVLAGFLVCLWLPGRVTAALPMEALGGGILDLLLCCIGFDLGAELDKLHLRNLAPHLLLVPFVNIALTLLCALAYSLLKGIPPREGMLVYAGLGWYSLSSVLIAGRGFVVLGLLAFIHNVFRELLAILTAPLAARISPYLPVYLGGATAMDVMLPFVQRSSGRAYTLVSFYSGVICSLAVIPLVNLLLAR